MAMERRRKMKEKNNTISNVFGVLQRVGKAFMLPIALLPAAGILLGVGGALLNVAALDNPPAIYRGLITFINLRGVTVALTVMRNVGDIVFSNLPLLFAIGIAVGLANSDKGTAALAGAVGFIIMHTAISTMLSLGVTSLGILTADNVPAQYNAYISTTLGIFTLNLSVFGGMIAGIIASILHNRYHKIQLPQILGFFGGSRFVPIVTAVVMLIVGVILSFIWPYVQNGIAVVAKWVNELGAVGTFLYGTIERALIPVGLHHVFYTPFWYTGFVQGTVFLPNGTTMIVDGANTAYFAQLSNMSALVGADPTTMAQVVQGTTRFMAGKFPFMIFGLGGAALAMYKNARPEKKAYVGGLLASAALTAAVTGITEPIEFTFLFVAPVLYAVHSVIAGLSYMIMDLLNVFVGMTFSGGLIDFALFGLLPAGAGVPTRWIYIIIVGVIFFVLYYLLFDIFIRKFNLKTPGREEDEESVTSNGEGKAKGIVLAARVLTALGGEQNIKNIDACITRLRVGLHDKNQVDKEALKALGATGVLEVGDNVQAIFGGRSDNIKNDIVDIMEGRIKPEDIEIAMGSEPDPIQKSEHVKKASYQMTPGDGHGEIIEKLIVPLKGELLTLKDIPDPVFSEGMMGQGFAINPAEGKLYAPIDGEIITVFPSKHAVVIKTKKGHEVLMHFGLDTILLKGEGFTAHVQEGQEVKAGDLLLTVDISAIEKKVPSLITPIVFPNLAEGEKVSLLRTGSVEAKSEDIIVIEK